MASEDELFAGFGADAGMFYSALVRSTDNYIYIINMKTDVALVSPNMQRDFELEGRLVPGLVTVWGNLVHPRDFKRYSKSMWSIRCSTVKGSMFGYAAAVSLREMRKASL